MSTEIDKYFGFFRGESYPPAYMTKKEWDDFGNFKGSKCFLGDRIDEYCNTILKDYRSRLPVNGIEVKDYNEL